MLCEDEFSPFIATYFNLNLHLNLSFQIPGGIFGPENEATLFDSINITDPVQRMKVSQQRPQNILPTKGRIGRTQIDRKYDFRLLVGLLGHFPATHR